ncbi:stage III sporulation protein AG [Shouchella shacheensis]|uniref:stage III sporulation protein AG n=1 Tax=Shouchella shacheensis TaxID=1649580 RepID=UPI00073FBA52|nr:stage III sporulation protein AG [Shouchella shacheensis]
MNDQETNEDWLKKWLPKQPKQKKKPFSPKYVLILGCIGVLLMVISQLFGSSPEEVAEPVVSDYEDEAVEDEEDTPVFGRKVEDNSMADYEMRYENQLRDSLEEIIGVEDVSIMVNLADTERSVYEKNVSRSRQDTKETDREGGSREVEDVTEEEDVVIVRNGDKEEPLVIATEKPSISGVLVVANGVENAQVKAWVVESVSRVLDVPPHRVSVMPKKSGEE